MEAQNSLSYYHYNQTYKLCTTWMMQSSTTLSKTQYSTLDLQTLHKLNYPNSVTLHGLLRYYMWLL